MKILFRKTRVFDPSARPQGVCTVELELWLPSLCGELDWRITNPAQRIFGETLIGTWGTDCRDVPPPACPPPAPPRDFGRDFFRYKKRKDPVRGGTWEEAEAYADSVIEQGTAILADIKTSKVLLRDQTPPRFQTVVNTI